MIVLDIETTGLSPKIHQMVSLGAVDYETGDEFYGECRIYKSDKWEQSALDINGFTVADITDPTKQSPYELYLKFINWTHGRSTVLAGQLVGSFDVQFLKKVHKRGSLGFLNNFPFHYQYVDLFSIAYAKFGEMMSMRDICIELGITPEPNIHNALNGAKCEYECFKLLLNN